MIKELAGIQIKNQIAGSVAKFAIRRKCSKNFMYDASMEPLYALLKCQLAYAAVFKGKQQPKVTMKPVAISPIGTLNSRKSRYIVKRKFERGFWTE